jgi:iron complex transport system substrate-binding protein
MFLLLGIAPATAMRVVSLNLCADDFLLTLAPEQAVAVTFLARDPSLSVVAAAAARLPAVRADAEAVLARRPDLVLASEYGAQATLAALRARGVRVELVRLPDSFAAIRAETARVAALLGEPARGAAAVRAMDRLLAAAHPQPQRRALLLEPRGWTAGPDSLGAAVLRAAGFATEGDGRQWSLEAVAAHPPDLLVVPRTRQLPSLATELLRHPAFRGIPHTDLPPSLLLCGGPWTARAVALLATP